MALTTVLLVIATPTAAVCECNCRHV